jgi:single-strand DNA-binding protein
MSIKNQCTFIGNVGNDIQIKHFDGGQSIGNVSIAVNENYTNKNGEKVEKTTWVNLVFRNKLAEVIEKYAPKGSKIGVSASYSNRSYDDNNGEKKYVHEFIVQSLELLTPKSDSQGKSNSAVDNYMEGSGAQSDDPLPF